MYTDDGYGYCIIPGTAMCGVKYKKKGEVFMKKIYETPTIEKVMFVSEDKVCGDMFGDLFGVNLASDTLNFTNEAIFQWENFEGSTTN